MRMQFNKLNLMNLIKQQANLQRNTDLIEKEFEYYKIKKKKTEFFFTK